ncbi:MAG: phosphoadenylyl-sulfate reductase [Verrucomicrobia bacterium]|nr:phosphoadenylyl-sulfate reductase [Verrucomicrobiota bacterium]
MIPKTFNPRKVRPRPKTPEGLDSEGLDPAGRIQWARKNFPNRAVATTSFGAQSAAFLHLIAKQWPELPVVFIDTGYHFPETLAFGQQLAQRLHLNVKIYRPLLTPREIESRHGKLWEQGPAGLDTFHEIIRVEPMRQAFRELQPELWVAGLRRSGSDHRQRQKVLSRQDSRWKLLPVLEWTDRDVGDYLKTHLLPYHPLWEKGYVSIGDRVTTKRLDEVSDPKELRHFGWKRECGLHERV